MIHEIQNEIRVKNEEIIIHLTGVKVFKNGKASIDARIIAEVEIDGKPYIFNNVMKIRVTKENKNE